MRSPQYTTIKPSKVLVSNTTPQDNLPPRFADPDGNDLTELEACEDLNLVFCSVFTEEEFPLPSPMLVPDPLHEMVKVDINPSGIEKLINDLHIIPPLGLMVFQLNSLS